MDTGAFLSVSYILIVFFRLVSLSYGMNLESASMTRHTLQGQTSQTGAERETRASLKSPAAASEVLRHYNIDTRDDDTEFYGQSGGSLFSYWMSLLSSTRKLISECEESSEKAVYQTRNSRLVNCVKNSMLRRVVPMLQVNGSRIFALNGVFEVERTDGTNFTLEDGQHNRAGRSDIDEEEVEDEDETEETEEELAKEPQDYVEDFDSLSKKLTIRVKLMPGLVLKMGRNSDGFKVGMELDEKDFEDLQGRGGTKKKLKKLKKFLPLLLIPIAVQFMLLPIVLGLLKLMAAKALLAGKLALILMLFNAAYTAVVPQLPEHNTKVANDFYGYDGGVEYGAYVNRRMERDRSLRQDLPYRAHR